MIEDFEDMFPVDSNTIYMAFPDACDGFIEPDDNNVLTPAQKQAALANYSPLFFAVGLSSCTLVGDTLETKVVIQIGSYEFISQTAEYTAGGTEAIRIDRFSLAD